MSTKDTILKQLKLKGKARADELALPLELTAMAVRQHLYQMQEDGVVECVSVPRGRGRPAKYWQLTPKSNIFFKDAHQEFSVELITSIRDILAESALNDLIKHRATKQKEQYLDAIGHSDLKDQLNTLAYIRSQEGYMADVIEENDKLFFVENHCPVCVAAQSCTGICAEELSVFKDIFKNKALVERTEHLLKGARRCAYKITPLKDA